MFGRRDPYAQFKNFVPQKNYNSIVKSRATKTNKLTNLYRVAQNRYVKQQEQLYREMKEAFGISLRDWRLIRAATKKGQQKLLENKLRNNPERAAKKVIDMLSVFPVAPPCPVLEPRQRAKVSTLRVLTRKGNSRKMLPKTPNSVYFTPKEPRQNNATRQNRQNQLVNAVSQRTRAKTKSKK